MKFETIQFSNKLEIIDISHNHFNGTLPEVFANGRNLRTLHVGHNELAGKLPRSLSKCSYLEVLNMEHNAISDTFPFWLESLQSLQVLVLHSNEFHGSLQHHHPKSASSFPELHIIDISYNSFSGILPFDFFVYLRAMYSERNRSELKYIGEERVYYQDDSLVLLNKGVEITYTRILTLLTAVDISGNRLHGEIPESIGLLKSLIVLNLSSNCFTGDIPSSLANLTMLESLDLSRNKLSGQIPPALGYLTSLSTVRVSHNQLVGQIPQGVQFQTQDSSSFEDNLGLCGRPLDKKCGDVDTEQLQEPESVEEKEEEEKVFSWTAAGIALAPGVILGLTIGHFVSLQNPQRLLKISVRQYKFSLTLALHISRKIGASDATWHLNQLLRLSITTMANSFTFLADLKAGRCSNNEEARLLTCWEICNIYRAIQHVSWTITEFSFSVCEICKKSNGVSAKEICVILELSSNLPRVLEVCTSAIPQAFLDGTDTNPSRLTEIACTLRIS
ncbi:hypothetical protein HID58_011859 [Brassica napus]|uniref:E3 ubiquitin-protein ligase RNF123/RKP TPR repeat domain-containing protein n=1 Tax=Brassica napus TaxID=3708 RepID=A0ABQ8DZE2_BRANA|nr:hypothetical protein HID58_011859 [Brassica napus]